MTGPLVYRQKVGFCRTDLRFSFLRERTKSHVNVRDEFSRTQNTRKYTLLDGINRIIAVFEGFVFFDSSSGFQNHQLKTTSIDTRSRVNFTPVRMSGGQQRKGRANREIKSWL